MLRSNVILERRRQDVSNTLSRNPVGQYLRSSEGIAEVESQMRSSLHVLAGALLVFAAAFLPLDSAVAQNERVWQVEKKLSGKDDDKKSDNVSGIACVSEVRFPRLCLVIDDNSQHVQLVTVVKDGKLLAGKRIRLIHDKYEDGAAEALPGSGPHEQLTVQLALDATIPPGPGQTGVYPLLSALELLLYVPAVPANQLPLIVFVLGGRRLLPVRIL